MANDGEILIQTEHLTKRFGKLVAVDGLNLEIHRGEVFGFLGPNAAGKTTTIGMMVGLIKPTAGRVKIFGLDIENNLPNILPKVGVVMDNPAFYPYLSGRDNLRLFSRVTGGINDDRIEQVLEVVDLTSRAKDKFKTYSLGMKQRVGVACALLHDPEFLILDEPTSGLDPAGMKEIRELITRLGQEGKTIFLSSHLLHEVEQVCDHMAIIKQGKLIAQGGVTELLRRGAVLELQVTDPDRAMTILQEQSWVSSVTREGDLLLVEAPSERATEISALLAKNDIFASEMKTRASTLESFFLEVTAEENNA
jgi:ABC-2 type transport system ATP-binding protein